MKKTNIDHYYATEDGLIYSDKTGTIKPMSIQTRRDGYQQTRVNGTSLVHRLVASAFLGDVTNLTVNHKDGNRSNNHVNNLEIVTMQENVIHAFKTGLSKKGEAHGKAKYSDEKIKAALSTIFEGKSVTAASKEHGISRPYLNNVKNGRYRS